MLDLKRDRLNYKNLLKPPCGYEIDKILITSYTLEVEKVIDICLLALGMQIEISAEDGKNKITSLHALEKMSKKLLVVCQNGNITKRENKKY